MPWRYNQEKGWLEYLVENEVAYCYPVPRTGAAIVAMMRNMLNASNPRVPRSELRALTDLLAVLVPKDD